MLEAHRNQLLVEQKDVMSRAWKMSAVRSCRPFLLLASMWRQRPPHLMKLTAKMSVSPMRFGWSKNS